MDLCNSATEGPAATNFNSEILQRFQSKNNTKWIHFSSQTQTDAKDIQGHIQEVQTNVALKINFITLLSHLEE